jgi:hypothetical protein
MTLTDLEARIERRKADMGSDGAGEVMPNSGESRTAGKRKLLSLLAAMAEARGFALSFKANIQIVRPAS